MPGLYDFVSSAVVKSGLQTPVFKGDIAGHLVLGGGFSPRKQPLLTAEKALHIEREAQRHLQEYQARVVGLITDLNQWKAEGHKTACRMLEPMQRWFEQQSLDFPSVATRPAFRQSRDALLQRLSTLCTLEVGTVMHEGIVSERIGFGTFGTLWKIESPANTSPLAFKVYHPQDLVISEKLRRFRRGYDAMRQLDHPHIVRVHQFIECPVGFYMDFIEGPNLRNLTGGLDDPKAMVQVLMTVGETLRHAHSRGVRHRDVKPENIVMSWDPTNEQWRPFLTDFDLAWFSTATQVVTKEGFGNVPYAAPEQWATPMAASAHAPTTDVYAFGQLCFFAASGSDPVVFEVADNVRALERRLGLGWSADAASAFVDLYSKCVKQKPAQRLQSFVEICDRLFRVLQNLSEISPHKELKKEQFIRELVFSMVGLSSENVPSESAFLTLSAKTRIGVDVKRISRNRADLVYDFQSQDSPILEGVQNFEQMRRTLLGRVETVLTQFQDTKKRYGSQGPFQVYVEHERVPLTMAGVALSRSVISRIVDSIEGK